jgi:hypothetical protein
MALAYTIRDRMMDRYIATVTSLAETNTAAKAVAYLSAEFLAGQLSCRENHTERSLSLFWEARRRIFGQRGSHQHQDGVTRDARPCATLVAHCNKLRWLAPGAVGID